MVNEDVMPIVSHSTPQSKEDDLLIIIELENGSVCELSLEQAQCWIEIHQDRVDNYEFTEGKVQVMDTDCYLPVDGPVSINYLNTRMKNKIRSAEKFAKGLN